MYSVEIIPDQAYVDSYPEIPFVNKPVVGVGYKLSEHTLLEDAQRQVLMFEVAYPGYQLRIVEKSN